VSWWCKSPKDTADLTKYTGLNVMSLSAAWIFDKQLKLLESLMRHPGRHTRSSAHLTNAVKCTWTWSK
jgi:hypothetical protein